MTIASMTGFARVSGVAADVRWAWELKSVNAKGLDVRLRLPPGFDSIDVEARTRLGKKLNRGTCYATLSVQREAVASEITINEALLHRLLASLAEVKLPSSVRPASLDGLLSVRGVVETVDPGNLDADETQVRDATLEGLDCALVSLLDMRQSEGAALGHILSARLAKLSALRQAAEDCPARTPEAIRARLQDSVALLAGHTGLDPIRLHQEAILLAAKADVQEELDRLATHIDAIRDHLKTGGPIGRRLDFLTQELGREANTLCAKSNAASLTAIGLELRVEIEQFREQVQNIE